MKNLSKNHNTRNKNRRCVERPLFFSSRSEKIQHYILVAMFYLALPIRLIFGRSFFSFGRKLVCLFFDAENAAYLRIARGKYFKIYFNDSYWIHYLLSKKEYEPDVRRVIDSVYNETVLFFDLGANKGYWTVYASNLFQNVLAVEASRETFHFLKENTSNLDNVTLYNAAVYNKSGQTLTLIKNYGDHAGARLGSPDLAGPSEYTEAVRTVAIDDLVPPGAAALIKLDVEGAEVAALKGATRALNDGGVIVYEDHGSDKSCASSAYLLGFSEIQVYYIQNDLELISNIDEISSIKVEKHVGYNFLAARNDSDLLKSILNNVKNDSNRAHISRAHSDSTRLRDPDAGGPVRPRVADASGGAPEPTAANAGIAIGPGVGLEGADRIAESPDPLSIVVGAHPYFLTGNARARFLVEPLEARGHRVTVLWADFTRRGLTDGHRNIGPNADAVVLFAAGPSLLSAAWAARHADVPLVVWLGGDPICELIDLARAAQHRGDHLEALRCRLRLPLRRWILRMADAAIIVNQAQRPTLAGRLRPGTPITVVPQFSSGPEPARTHDLGDPVALLTVTNLEFRSKADGVIRLVDHLAAFAATDGRRLRLTVAGGGAELPCIEAVLAARKLPDTLEVVPLGFVRDVEPLYAEADLFLYHSEHDATPSVILESKRHGLPLLANDHAPFRTLVAHGETGFLFRDAAQFHDLFARLLDEAALRERLGTAARADHRARFTVEAVGPPLEAAIAAAVRAGRRSTRRAAP